MRRELAHAITWFLIFFFAQRAAAIEPGDATFQVLGGYQEGIVSDIGPTYYSGFRLRSYQPTLNWGTSNLHFLLLNTTDSESETDLGYELFTLEDFWLLPGFTFDGFAGDGPMLGVTPRLVFEHVALPAQALRGFSGELHSDQGGEFGFHYGDFTQVNPIFPEAVETIGEDVKGGFASWLGSDGSMMGAGYDELTDAEGERFLTSLFVTKPLKEWEGRVAGWYDSRSRTVAGTMGVLKAAETGYAELGLSHIPEDFNYISRRARLPSGQTLAFGTWRRTGISSGYYAEGSSGWQEGAEDGSWLSSGSLGGYYKLRLRDTVSTNLRATHTRSEDGETRLRLGETFRYRRARERWDSGLMVQMRQLLLSPAEDTRATQAPAAVVEEPEAQAYDWIGELLAHFRSDAGWDAGGSLRFELREARGQPDRYLSTLELRGSTMIGFDVLASGFVRAGYAWSTENRGETYGGGLQLAIPLWWDFLLRLRGLAQESRTEALTILGPLEEAESSQTTAEVFASIERSVFWGEPAPVHGRFEGFQPRGVGDLWGRVFADENGNRRFDKGEQPIAEAVLVMDDGFIVETDVAGLFRYPNVAAGDHDIYLDPASYPIEYTDPNIEGIRFKLYPRQDKQLDWPLEVSP